MPTREQRRQYDAAYRQRHRAEIRTRGRERYAAASLQPELVEKRKTYAYEYMRKYRERRHVELSAYMHKYREQHYVEISAKQREYRQRHHAELIAYRREYDKHAEIKVKVRESKRERYASDPAYRLQAILRGRLTKTVRRSIRAGSAVRDLGCTIEEFMAYIADRFLPGMSWENWGKWHLDHIRPLASFDLSDREQFLAACHYTNLQPLWAVDNLRKGTRTL